MPDIPRSAIESAIHAENQAAQKTEHKGPLEGLRELWGALSETLVGHGVTATRETLGNIFDAGVDIARDAIAGVQREAEVAFWGKPNMAHAPDEHQSNAFYGKPDTAQSPAPSIHDNAPVVEAIEKLPASFAEIMKAQAEMAPPRDEPSQEHDQGPER